MTTPTDTDSTISTKKKETLRQLIYFDLTKVCVCTFFLINLQKKINRNQY